MKSLIWVLPISIIIGLLISAALNEIAYSKSWTKWSAPVQDPLYTTQGFLIQFRTNTVTGMVEIHQLR